MSSTKSQDDTNLIIEIEQDASEEETLLEDSLPSLEQQLAEMKDNWLRALAENENLRRRFQKEREDALKYGAVHLGRDMVGIADNLDRALKSCPLAADVPTSIQSLVSGVEMTAKELLTTFERHGIKKISPLEQLFDPHFHQAVLEIETDKHLAGTVVQVMQDGYIMHERLLRAAMVGVAKSAVSQTQKDDPSPTCAIDTPA